MSKFRKKPVVIEAIQYLREENMADIQDWFAKNNSSRDLFYYPKNNSYSIRTPGGEYILTKGDYIIKDIKGEFYSCKPDIFEVTYEKVSNENE